MWRPCFEFFRMNRNHHIYRKGKFGPKFGVRRKGFSLVELGLGYADRLAWGWRLWHYKKDGSCCAISIFMWNGKQRGVQYAERV